jgi:hypothetical protein
MAIRAIVGIIALACVSACGIIATFAHYEMMDKVNEKLTEGERFQPSGWCWSKSQRLRREYRRMYPNGRLLFKIRVLMAVMIALLLTCLWGFESFGR